jgi:hypothetical protein
MWWPSNFKTLITHRFYGYRDLLTFVWTWGCVASLNLFHVGFARLTAQSGWNCTAMDKASRCAVFAISHLQNVSSQALQVRHPKRAKCFRSKLEQEPWSGSSQYSLLRGKLEENENYNGSGGVTLVLSPTRCHSTSIHSMWGLKVSASD